MVLPLVELFKYDLGRLASQIKSEISNCSFSATNMSTIEFLGVLESYGNVVYENIKMVEKNISENVTWFDRKFRDRKILIEKIMIFRENQDKKLPDFFFDNPSYKTF